MRDIVQDNIINAWHLDVLVRTTLKVRIWKRDARMSLEEEHGERARRVHDEL